jgi:F0F1-type ATP synthase membrane subunit b/b'
MRRKMSRGSARQVPRQAAPAEQADLDTVARVLALAQQTADQAIADAQAEAARIIAAAHQQAEQIVADARARVDTSSVEPF